MRYLLDTHAILWYVGADPDFPQKLREEIDSSECFYSMASLWEIAIKQSLGRLNRNIAIPDLAAICRMAGFHPLPLLPKHLERIKSLPDIHRDPFDRLLVAQALEENLAVITRDGMIPRYPIQTVWE